MNRIKELREKMDETQRELAEKMNVSQSAISSWERGVFEPSDEAIKYLADHFGVTIDYLLGHVTGGKTNEATRRLLNDYLEATSNIGLSPGEVDRIHSIIQGMLELMKRKL